MMLCIGAPARGQTWEASFALFYSGWLPNWPLSSLQVSANPLYLSLRPMSLESPDVPLHWSNMMKEIRKRVGWFLGLSAMLWDPIAGLVQNYRLSIPPRHLMPLTHTVNIGFLHSCRAMQIPIVCSDGPNLKCFHGLIHVMRCRMLNSTS